MNVDLRDVELRSWLYVDLLGRTSVLVARRSSWLRTSTWNSRRSSRCSNFRLVVFKLQNYGRTEV